MELRGLNCYRFLHISHRNEDIFQTNFHYSPNVGYYSEHLTVSAIPDELLMYTQRRRGGCQTGRYDSLGSDNLPPSCLLRFGGVYCLFDARKTAADDADLRRIFAASVCRSSPKLLVRHFICGSYTAQFATGTQVVGPHAKISG